MGFDETHENLPQNDHQKPRPMPKASPKHHQVMKTDRQTYIKTHHQNITKSYKQITNISGVNRKSVLHTKKLTCEWRGSADFEEIMTFHSHVSFFVCKTDFLLTPDMLVICLYDLVMFW
jgi:hypothetical protein